MLSNISIYFQNIVDLSGELSYEGLIARNILGVFVMTAGK